jgi:SAM-dependent methyltransferase
MRIDSRIKRILRNADAHAQSSNIGKMFDDLRKLSLEEFAGMMLSPPEEFPNLTAALPSMASEDTQRHWTGSYGTQLLQQSIEFVRKLETAYRRHVGRDLNQAEVLDFGCGWGRLIRLLYRYTPPERLYAVDPWNESLEACHAARLYGNFELSHYIPRELPFGTTKFRLIYAYSVFTHLSPKTMQIAQQTLRSRVEDDGLLVVTIRPEEFWRYHGYWPEGYSAESMIEQHRARGVAFLPHIRPPVEGEITYGDTSISLAYMARQWTGWEVVESQPLVQDPVQLVTVLKPR